MIHASRTRAFLPGGQVLSVTALSWEVGLPAFKGVLRHQVHKAVALARLAEPLEDLGPALQLESRCEGVLPQAADADAFALATQLMECAGVLTDRAARGLMRMPAQGAVVLAASADWSGGALLPLAPPWDQACLAALLAQPDLGEVLVLLPGDAQATAGWPEHIRARHPQASVRAADNLLHFSGSLHGLRRPRAAEVLFPVLGLPGQEALHPVRVVVSPLPPGHLGDGTISVVGSTDLKMASSAERAVWAVRACEPLSSRQWQTVIHLPPLTASGPSFELAVVVADRMARGREWPGPGRVIATGGIDTQAAKGRVLHVDNALPGLASASKTALIGREALPYDTVLLPASWQGTADISFASSSRLDPLAAPQVVYVAQVPA